MAKNAKKKIAKTTSPPVEFLVETEIFNHPLDTDSRTIRCVLDSLENVVGYIRELQDNVTEPLVNFRLNVWLNEPATQRKAA